MLSDLDFANASKILNLPDPTLAQHPATKAYVDAAIEGLAWKDSVRVATQSNISISAPGATIDSISMVSGDRFLVRSQSTASENGIYVWNGAAVAATRANDCNTAAELEQAITTVEEGTSAGVSYRQTSINFTLGSSSISWTVFGASAGSASTSSAGIVTIATQAEVDAGTDTVKVVTPATLNAFASRVKKYAATFGDGSQTQYDITHNLNTNDVQVEVYLVSTGESVIVDVKRTSVNVVRINFSAAPALNAYRVVVLG